MKIKITKLPKSEVEIEGEIESTIFDSYFNKALKSIAENAEIDGFRKGKVPENILLEKIPQMHILEQAAEMALNDHYPKIITENNIDAISKPEISITKIAKGSDLGFKIKTAILPVITLPDYKKNAKKIIEKNNKEKKDLSVTEEELENTIMDIRKSRAPRKNIKDVAHEHKDGKEHDHKHEEEKLELPNFDDEFVKNLGPFENVEDFKTKLKENIKLEKENKEKENIRLLVIEDLIKESEIDVPQILIDLELDKILYSMESDITNMGMKFEDYLKHLNKNVLDLRTEFTKDAEKKAKLSLILNEIAKLEKIELDQKEIEKEVNQIMEHYKDADRTRATIHVQNILSNEKIFELLERE